MMKIKNGAEGRPMDPTTVEKLESKIEEAIAGNIVVKMGLKKLPLLPARRRRWRST
jgi:hypothetical protein